MIPYSSTDVVIGVIGFIGLLSVVATLTYSFRRNKTGDGKYQ